MSDAAPPPPPAGRPVAWPPPAPSDADPTAPSGPPTSWQPPGSPPAAGPVPPPVPPSASSMGGVGVGQPAYAAPAYPAPATQPGAVVVRPLRAIGSATRWLIAATALMSLVTIAVDASGVAAIEGYLAGTAGLEGLETYDAATLPSVLVWTAVLIASAVCWLVWQYRAAKSVDPIFLRRKPSWHVGYWFVPVANWWWPFQNVKDLVRGSQAPVSQGILGTWWALWLVSNLVSWFANRQIIAADSLEPISAALPFSIAGDVLLIACAAFAWIIVKRITDALDPPH